MNDPNQFQITTAKGLNSFAPRGSSDMPFKLMNALLRVGMGWACAPQAQLMQADVVAALSASQGRSLFIQKADGALAYWNGTTTSPIPNTDEAGSSLTGVPVMANLAFVEVDGVWSWLHPTFGIRPIFNPQPLLLWDGVGPTPSVPCYRPTNIDAPRYATVRLVPVRGPDGIGVTDYAGVTEFNVPLDFHTYVYNITYAVNIYIRLATSDGQPTGRFVEWGTNLNMSGEVLEFFVINPYVASTSSPHLGTDVFAVRPTLATYHQGRVWATGTAQQYDPISTTTPLTLLPENPLRLYHSDVITAASSQSLPFFAGDYWIDIPFRVSTRITALQVAGRYLYVFGEGEVMILSGSDDTTWQIEQLADSIGTTAPESVQTLQNTVFYLSDSSLLALTSGQVADVGLPIQDRLLDLNRAHLSSTVDFQRELYYISDGTTTLVYNAREQGWTERQIDAPNQRLLYSGGKPYSLHDGGLYSLDAADLLPLEIHVGPFGVPGWRKRWRGITCAVDSTGSANLAVRAVGLDIDMDENVTRHDSPTQYRSIYPGLTPVQAGLESNTAALMEVAIVLTPEVGCRRCILRSPVTVVGQGGTEAWA